MDNGQRQQLGESAARAAVRIAQVLETSEGALKASYHHAYEKVKAWMKESLEAKY